jgi:type IV pilus assembly protein PilP
VLLISVSGLTGCSDAGKQAQTGTPVVVQPKPQVITQATVTAADAKQQDEFTYYPVGKRDPFSPIVVREDQKARAGDRPPLERYGLQEFNLTGVVWGGYGYSAMLEGPDKKGYFVKIGTIIGPNKGVVKKITSHSMVVEEKFKSISGEIDRREIVIELRKKQEGMQ